MAGAKPVQYPYIEISPEGQPRIKGTNYTIEQIVRKTTARMSPAHILERFDGLTLAQLHAAFLYYHDHGSEFEDALRRRQRTALTATPLSSLPSPSSVQQKLTEKWKRLTQEGTLPRTK